MAYVERFNFKDVNSHLLSEEAEKEYLEYEKKHSMLAQQKNTIKISKKNIEEQKWAETMKEFFKKGEELNARRRFKVSNRRVNK